jgi:LysM repeat protein
MEWDQETDARWSIEWEWISRNEEEAQPFKLDTPAVAANDVLGALDEALDVIAEGAIVTRQMTAMVVSDIAAIQETTAELIDNLTQIGSVLTAPQTIVGAIVYNVKELGRHIQEVQSRVSGSRIGAVTADAIANAADGTNGNSVRNKTGQLRVSQAGEQAQPAGVPSTVTAQATGGVSDPTASNLGAIDIGNPPSNGVTATAQLESWRRNVAVKLAILYLTAEQAAAAEIARVKQQPNRTIVSRSGDTLYSISTREYGSPDFANFLAQSNGLRDAIVPPGTSVKIPPRPLGAASKVDFTSSGEGVSPSGV